jgi:hypothetical protein
MPRGTSASRCKASSYHKLPSLLIIERDIAAHTHDTFAIPATLEIRQQEFLAIPAAETTFPGLHNSIAHHRCATIVRQHEALAPVAHDKAANHQRRDSLASDTSALPVGAAAHAEQKHALPARKLGTKAFIGIIFDRGLACVHFATGM